MYIFLPRWVRYFVLQCVVFLIPTEALTLMQSLESLGAFMLKIHALDTESFYKSVPIKSYMGLKTCHLHTSSWTHSEVICTTSCREVKPELRKLSLYWLILMAASQSSTELKVLTSGMDLSSSGWEGLVQRRTPRARRGGRWDIVGLWCNIKHRLKEKESKADTGVFMGVCHRVQGN